MLTSSLEEYEYYFSKLKRLFDVNKVLDVEDKNITVPVIISGIINAQKLGESGLIMEYAEYLESLTPQSGLTEVIQDDRPDNEWFYVLQTGGTVSSQSN